MPARRAHLIARCSVRWHYRWRRCAPGSERYLADLRRPVDGRRISARGVAQLLAHRHHPLWLRIAAHCFIRVVAVRPDHRRQADGRDRRPDRKRHLGAAFRVVAGDRPFGERGGDGDDNRRHSAGAGQPQIDPGLIDAAGQGDRSRRLAEPIRRGARMTLTALGLPTVPGRSADSTDERAVAAPALQVPTAGPLLDPYGRAATDLRVSLTDRCNLRCSYCMPADGLDWLPGEQLLRPDELARLMRIAVTRLGITSVRFTGGEPLLSRHLEEVVAAAASLRPRPEISLTTNGVGLVRRGAAAPRG